MARGNFWAKAITSRQEKDHTAEHGTGWLLFDNNIVLTFTSEDSKPVVSHGISQIVEY